MLAERSAHPNRECAWKATDLAVSAARQLLPARLRGTSFPCRRRTPRSLTYTSRKQAQCQYARHAPSSLQGVKRGRWKHHAPILGGCTAMRVVCPIRRFNPMAWPTHRHPATAMRRGGMRPANTGTADRTTFREHANKKPPKGGRMDTEAGSRKDCPLPQKLWRTPIP